MNEHRGGGRKTRFDAARVVAEEAKVPGDFAKTVLPNVLNALAARGSEPRGDGAWRRGTPPGGPGGAAPAIGNGRASKKPPPWVVFELAAFERHSDCASSAGGVGRLVRRACQLVAAMVHGVSPLPTWPSYWVRSVRAKLTHLFPSLNGFA